MDADEHNGIESCKNPKAFHTAVSWKAWWKGDRDGPTAYGQTRENAVRNLKELDRLKIRDLTTTE